MMEQAAFLKEYRCEASFQIAQEKGLTWGELMRIAERHENNRALYQSEARRHAETIRGFTGIHTVKHRVKDTEHLIEKIIRKMNKPDVSIDLENYLDEITDIIGIRAIHIFRADSEVLFDQICRQYKKSFAEKPVVKMRNGDDVTPYQKMINRGAAVEFAERYRSVHYLIRLKSNAKIELQTRTIFEEGWSAPDHELLYKHSDNKHLLITSSLLSRMAGNCDDLVQMMYEEAAATKDREPDADVKAGGAQPTCEPGERIAEVTEEILAIDDDNCAENAEAAGFSARIAENTDSDFEKQAELAGFLTRFIKNN
ncbi:MAG: hypothetical protein LBH24_04525 [Clostridiales bacterium]|jgi:ppGpp synthetase/RelA/SpoT-type nucleotidyltranferase|nr:hypothetical protein [Clostridiales bacterium]